MRCFANFLFFDFPSSEWMTGERFESLETFNSDCAAGLDILLFEMFKKFHESMVNQRGLTEIKNDFLTWLKLSKYLFKADQVGKYCRVLHIHIVLVSIFLQLVTSLEKITQRSTVYDVEDELDENARSDTHEQIA